MHSLVGCVLCCHRSDSEESAAPTLRLANWLLAKLTSVASRLRGNSPPPPEHHGDPESVAGGNEEVVEDTEDTLPKPSEPEQESIGQTATEDVPVCYLLLQGFCNLSMPWTGAQI